MSRAARKKEEICTWNMSFSIRACLLYLCPPYTLSSTTKMECHVSFGGSSTSCVYLSFFQFVPSLYGKTILCMQTRSCIRRVETKREKNNVHAMPVYNKCMQGQYEHVFIFLYIPFIIIITIIPVHAVSASVTSLILAPYKSIQLFACNHFGFSSRFEYNASRTTGHRQ